MQDGQFFRAAVLRETGGALELMNVRFKTFKPGDVLVKIRAAGLCHSDLEVIDGSLRRPLPIVLGHEAAGTVVRTGAAVEGLRPGDHVVCSWNPNCGQCFYCTRNSPILCEPLTRNHPRGNLMDGDARLELEDGTPLHHFSGVSGLAEYCVVHASAAIKIPAALPFDQACLIGCAVMTGIGSVVRLARVEPGSAIAVVGAGPVGLSAVQGGVLAGAAVIVAVDSDPGKLHHAAEFGATHVVDARSPNAIAHVQSLTEGRGADYVFEAAGATAAMQLGLELLRPGGSMVILGKTREDEQLSFRFGSLMKEKHITRSSYGGARPARDFPWIAQLALDGRLRIDKLITRRLALCDVNDGIDLMRERRGLRTVVEFPG